MMQTHQVRRRTLGRLEPENNVNGVDCKDAAKRDLEHANIRQGRDDRTIYFYRGSEHISIGPNEISEYHLIEGRFQGEEIANLEMVHADAYLCSFYKGNR